MARARNQLSAKRVSTPADPTSVAIPPLENGDRLTREEFERRYDAMPELKKAELIQGVVYMGSPVRFSHGRPHALVMTWLGHYEAATPGVLCGDNSSLIVDEENEPQPDSMLFIAEGGAARLERDYVHGAPEFVAEIAVSSVSLDNHLKKRLYEQAGVKEYMIWRVLEGAIDWFELTDDKYVAREADADGVLRSRAIPGLWLAREPMLALKMKEVLEILNEGFASPEHAVFVNRISKRS
jgi:Uma2 family endonuclease